MVPGSSGVIHSHRPRAGDTARPGCHHAVMPQRQQRIHRVTVHPAHYPGTPVVLRARRHRRRGEDLHELIDAALELGLVPGDIVSCRRDGTDELHMVRVESLRNGTLGTVLATGRLRPEHVAQTLTRIGEDWQRGRCRVVDRHGPEGLSGFWPAAVSFADADMTVVLSAAEFRLECFVSGLPERLAYIRQQVDLPDLSGADGQAA